MHLLKITLLVALLIIIGWSIQFLYTLWKTQKAKEKMLKEVTQVYEILTETSDLFDYVGGYEETLKFLKNSINWLSNGICSKSQFKNFKMKFKKKQQNDHKGFWVTSLLLYPNPYFKLEPLYFGQFTEDENSFA